MQLTSSVSLHTIDLLLTKYKLSTRFINIMLASYGLDTCEEMVEMDLDNAQKLKLILGAAGSELFIGRKKLTIDLRKKIIEKWTEAEIQEQFEKRIRTNGNSRTHKINNLSGQRWHSGKSWANTFVKISGFNSIFSGIANDAKKDPFEDIVPIQKPPVLKDFQIQLKHSLIRTLNEKGDKAKCVISLPTGGGKTRTAVEAFVEWLQPRFSEGKYLIWLAQSEELCEQAIASISQVWSSREFTDNLRIYRYFGSHNVKEENLNGGVIIATINKLYNGIRNENEIAEEVLGNCGAMIIDEAHRAITPMYQTVYEFSAKLNGIDMFPICGLTATPGRTQETKDLSNFFNANLYTPDLGEEFEKNPLQYFRDKRFLANPIHKTIRTNYNMPSIEVKSATDEEEFRSNLEEEFKTKLNRDLAKDRQRNRTIINTLKNIKKGELSLVYTCTVNHAVYLSSIMNFYGRSSVVVSSETRNPLRRKYIEQFKKGEIEFIFNYGVLTTGFDAPKTENIVICRPTFSDVLYEQIVGRGLRGPEFGGTDFCTIYDFSDNYERFGDQQSYTRFSEFWVRQEEEEASKI